MVVYAQPDTAMLGLISTAHCCAPHLQHQLWAQLLCTCPGRANTLLARCKTLLSGVAQVDTAGKQKFSIHFVIRDIQNNMGKVCKFSTSQPPFRVLGKKPFFYSRDINPAKANKILEVTCFLWCSVALLEQWSLEFFIFFSNLTLSEVSGWVFFEENIYKFYKIWCSVSSAQSFYSG